MWSSAYCAASTQCQTSSNESPFLVGSAQLTSITKWNCEVIIIAVKCCQRKCSNLRRQLDLQKRKEPAAREDERTPVETRRWVLSFSLWQCEGNISVAAPG